MNESDDGKSQPGIHSFALRTAGGLFLGAIPGALVADFVSRRAGLATIFLGVPVGLIIAFGIAAPGRLLRLLLAVLVARNVPSLQQNAFEWVDRGSRQCTEVAPCRFNFCPWLWL